MALSYIRIEWHPSSRPTDVRLLIDRPITKIRPNSTPHLVLDFIRNEGVLEKLLEGRSRIFLTPMNVSVQLNKKSSDCLLYPLLEKMWLSGLIEKQWEWMSQPWWWTQYGENKKTLDALQKLDQGEPFEIT